MAGKVRSEASSSSRTTTDANTTYDDNHNSNSNGGGGVGGGGESLVFDFGRNRSSCGYCKSPGRTSISHGLLARSLTVNDYQDLLDRGWRRSGSFLYKPEMERSCCPSYTIRLRAREFAPSKEQLRVIGRVQRFLDGSLHSNKPLKLKEGPHASKETSSSADLGGSSFANKECLSGNNAEKNEAEKILQYLSDQIDSVVHTCVDSGDFPNDLQLPKASVKKVSQGKRKLFVEGSETLLYSSNIAFQIAAAIKKRTPQGVESSLQSRVSGEIVNEKELSPKAISEKLASSLNQLAETSGLSVRSCNGHINFYSGTNKVSLDGTAEGVTVSEGSAARHKNKPRFSGNSQEHTPVNRRRLEIHLKRSSFDPEEFALYRRYQIKVHNETPDFVTESSYKRFLVDTPLIFVPPTKDGTVPPCGFGSFHQQYVIDGQLVAVGVIDILPRCLSSKYLFWDPDFAFLSLGKYSAVQEINWVKETQSHCPSLQFYYLGYYIHSCNKMRYKASYRPSELLCPLRYQWVSFDVARPFLDRTAYVVLSDCALLPDGESSAPNASEQAIEVQHNDNSLEGSNDVYMHQADEATDPEFEMSDDESGEESSDQESVQLEAGDINNILIGLKGSCLKYKDLQQGFHLSRRSYLETQLHRYLRVVGKDVGERMIYSLG